MAENEIKEDNFLEDHEFDGIRELDNPPPPWIMWVLYFTIFWAALYWVHFHVFKQGDLQDAEYAHEVEKAEKKANEREVLAKANTVEMSDVEMTKLGKELYSSKGCTACHGALGEGNAIGPNLTDNYWLHGNSDDEVFKAIKFGFPTKGMTPYKDQLTDEKIKSLAFYVKKELVGTNPEGAKEAQGELVK